MMVLFFSFSSSAFFSLSLLLILLTTIPIAQCQLREEDRMREYHLRNYTWPREFYNPPTKGWKQIYDRRFAQVSDIPDTGNRYEGYKQICSSAITAPTFTEFGFAVTRAPKDLVEDLREAVIEGLPNARLESNVEVIEGGPETRPLFIHRPDLMRRVLHELLPMHEVSIIILIFIVIFFIIYYYILLTYVILKSQGLDRQETQTQQYIWIQTL